MACGVRVFGRVPIRRAVAAKRDSTSLAGPQMHPLRADLYAFFAFAALRLFDRIDRVKMRATSIGHDVILAAPDERKQLRLILRRQPRRLASRSPRERRQPRTLQASSFPIGTEIAPAASLGLSDRLASVRYQS